MDLFNKRKDGGPESTGDGLFIFAEKKIFSVVLLTFHGKSREAYHSHAFNCISWILKGKLTENMLDGKVNVYQAGFTPIFTKRDTFHKVDSDGDTVVLTFRGPWKNTWKEFLPNVRKYVTLTHGRKVINE